MSEKRWIFVENDHVAADRLARGLDVSSLTATLLVNRGIRDVAEGRVFLRPELSALIDPYRFRDMKEAVDRLFAAVRGEEKVGIFGDYDVDGTSGTAILVRFLQFLGHPVVYRIPHRVEDGYGLNRKVVEEFAAGGVRVVVTVDCGTGNREEIALARSLGMDVIVVDHHEAPEVLPDAVAILNPKLARATYPFAGICSTGIAFKLAWAMADRLAPSRKQTPEFRAFLLDAMSCVALGTIADVSPLVGENRILVTYGLDALRHVPSPGLRALLARARVGEKPIDGYDVGFKLAPRLNALGRIGHAQRCVDLLVSRSEEQIEEIVEELETFNRRRRGIEGEILAQALEQIESESLARDSVLVVADPRWHLGVVGIVAARLVDRFARPAVVLAAENGVAKGSARSVEGLALHEALAACTDVLERHGGHAMAAGLTIQTSRIPDFRRRINEFAAGRLNGRDLRPKLRIDGEVSLAELTLPVVREIRRLAPHGEGNPRPVLAASHVRIVGEPRLIGKKGDHVSLFASQGGPGIRAVGFGMGARFEEIIRARTCALAFTPDVNAWNGTENVELKLEDVKTE